MACIRLIIVCLSGNIIHTIEYKYTEETEMKNTKFGIEIELRGFNSTLSHAGVVRSYIVLALALNNQDLTQKCASSKKPQVDNEKFAFRTYLNRIGFIGEDYKN